MLYLLTFADMRAVGPGVMTGWQAQILWRAVPAHARPAHRRASASRPTREAVAPRVWEAMHREGRAAHGGRAPRDAVGALSRDDVAPAHRRAPAARRAARGGRRSPPSSSTTPISTPPSSSSPPATCRGSSRSSRARLAAHGINILSAQIHTRADGIAIDTFQVNDPFGEAVTEEARWRRTLDALRRVLRGEETRGRCSSRGAGRGGRAPRGVPGPPKVSVDNQLSDTPHRRRGEVPGPRRAALRHHAHAVRAAASTSRSARIATEIDQAYDTFYVTDRQGRRVEDPAAMARVRESARRRLVQAALDAEPLQGLAPPGRRPRRAAAAARARAAESPHDARARRERRRGACVLARGGCARGRCCSSWPGSSTSSTARWRGSPAARAPSGPSSTPWWTATPTWLVLLGIVLYYQRGDDTAGVFLTMIALVGTVMVSYTKARAQSIGVPCEIGAHGAPRAADRAHRAAPRSTCSRRP